MSNYAYQVINGELLPQEQATIPLNDVGLLRSLAVFDYLRVENNVPVFLEEHVNRIVRSADLLGLDPHWKPEQINAMCRQLVDTCKPGEAGLRIVITGGFSEDGYAPSTPNIYVMLNPLPVYPAEAFVSGGTLITSEYQRDTPEAKTTIYLKSFQERKRMQEAGAVEILYHLDGKVSECSRSNIFLVNHDGQIITPKDGILMGITRKHVIEIASNEHEVTSRDVRLDEVLNAAEVFITSTAKGVMPIVRIDDRQIAGGEVGEITRKIQTEFRQLVDGLVGN